MPFVVDASITARWVLPDERDEHGDEILAALVDGFGFAPDLWWFEVHNLLLMNERRKRVSSEKTAEALNLLLNLPIDLDFQRDAERTFNLARKHRLTFYDAAYLELAMRKAVPLATHDAALISAAEVEGVRLL